MEICPLTEIAPGVTGIAPSEPTKKRLYLQKDKMRYPKQLMAKIEGQGPPSSTKQTPWILKVCAHYSEDFCPNVTEIRPVSPSAIMLLFGKVQKVPVLTKRFKNKNR